MFRVTLAPTLALAQTVKADITVEAEYGATVMAGTALTLAHHQRDGRYSTAAGARAPCCTVVDGGALADLLGAKREVQVLVSHLDLDTVGGVGRAIAALFAALTGAVDTMFRSANEPFWLLAEFVDLNGPHKLSQAGAAPEDLRALRAYHAWAQGRPRQSREALTDVTEEVSAALAALTSILGGDEALLAAGDKFAADEAALNAASFVEVVGGVAVRVHGGFVNHLYATPSGVACGAVVAMNPVTGSVIISLADPVNGVSCRDLVQELWGPEAGGHAGIAGSPRGQRMGLDDIIRARGAVAKALSPA